MLLEELIGVKAAGILAVYDGRILLGQRSYSGDNSGKWSIPGGKLKKGETFEQAAAREFKEETSYSGKFVNLKPLYTYKDKNLEFRTFIAFLPLKPNLKGDFENLDLRWFNLNKLPPNLHHAFKEMLENKWQEIKSYMS